MRGTGETNLNERPKGGNEGWMSAEICLIDFRGSLRHLNLLRTREREHSRGNVLSPQQMPRGTRRRMKESEAQTPAGCIRKSSSKCSKHWMNISPRERFDFAFECKCERNAWTRRALLIAQTREEANIVDLFEGNSLYKAHFTRGSGTSAVVHE
ncbi:MAG: hypothetical protein ACTS53_01745 [Candidatus Hodgkinia cicadicola]